MFPHVGLREWDKAYSVQIGPVVGITRKRGPDYSSDAAIMKEVCDEEEMEREAGEDPVVLMVQVNT